MTRLQLLYQLRRKVFFLNLVPDSIYFNLHTDEFAQPTLTNLKHRARLERQTNNYVMIYRARTLNLNNPVRVHLCAHLKQAKLTAQQLSVLQKFEDQVKAQFLDLSFCIYQKPMTIIPVEKSALFGYQTGTEIIK